MAPKAVIAAATAFFKADTCPGDIPAGTADDQFDGWLFASARFLPKAENEVENVETVKPGFPSVRSLTGRAGGVFHFSARKIWGHSIAFWKGGCREGIRRPFWRTYKPL